MWILMFYQSLVSDWNRGHAHCLRARGDGADRARHTCGHRVPQRLAIWRGPGLKTVAKGKSRSALVEV